MVGRTACDIESKHKRDQQRAAKLKRKHQKLLPLPPPLTVEQQRKAYEEHAINNPCRNERCHIQQLHPAH